MKDPFIIEQEAEEKAQRALLNQRGVDWYIENPDIKVVKSSGNPEIYKVTETELLKLKMKITQGNDMQGSDRNHLANLIHVLISQGGEP